ncbi:MAG: hypothetical protein AAFN07_13970 [Pseudomonadota bacterium]
MRRFVLVISALLLCPAEALAGEHDYPILDAYLSVFRSKVADELPLSDDVTFYGSLLPEPIVGRNQVITFFNKVAPSVQLRQVKQAFEGANGACAELVFYFEGADVLLEEAHCIQIKDGKILSIRLYYDPRPLMGGN